MQYELPLNIDMSGNILLVHHYDADGITAVSLVMDVLERLGASYERVMVDQLYSDTEIDRDFDFYIFLDLGGKYDRFLEGNMLILDHHGVGGDRTVLPENIGYSGDVEASTSTLTAYLFDVPPPLRYVSLVGAAGDRQFVDGSFVGLNRRIAYEGTRSGDVLRMRDIVVRQDRPLGESLWMWGLEGDEIYALFSLSSLHQLAGRRWDELSLEEKRAVASTLYLYYIRKGGESPIGERYHIRDRGFVRDIATLVNACGRLGKEERAIEFLRSGRGLHSLHDVYHEYRREVGRSLRRAIDEVKKDGIWYFVTDIPHYLVGVVTGMIHSWVGDVVVGVSCGDYAKVSVRGGEDVGRVLSGLCRELGGEGGGHSSAGGCRIPCEYVDDLINRLKTHLL